jgi:hypothetical protein
VAPASTENETPSTARSGPASVSKTTWRFLSSNNGKFVDPFAFGKYGI